MRYGLVLVLLLFPLLALGQDDRRLVPCGHLAFYDRPCPEDTTDEIPAVMPSARPPEPLYSPATVAPGTGSLWIEAANNPTPETIGRLDAWLRQRRLNRQQLQHLLHQIEQQRRRP